MAFRTCRFRSSKLVIVAWVVKSFPPLSLVRCNTSLVSSKMYQHYHTRRPSAPPPRNLSPHHQHHRLNHAFFPLQSCLVSPAPLPSVGRRRLYEYKKSKSIQTADVHDTPQCTPLPVYDYGRPSGRRPPVYLSFDCSIGTFPTPSPRTLCSTFIRTYSILCIPTFPSSAHLFRIALRDKHPLPFFPPTRTPTQLKSPPSFYLILHVYCTFFTALPPSLKHPSSSHPPRAHCVISSF